MAELLTCAQSEELLAMAGTEQLSADDRAVLDAHLAHCAHCRAAAQGYRSVVELLPEALPPVSPPARLRRALLAQVYAEHPGAGPAAPSWRRLWQRVPSGRGFTVAGALAAAVALVTAATLVSQRGGNQHGPSSQPVAVVQHFAITGTTAQRSVTGDCAYDPQAHRAVVLVHGLSRAASNQVYELWLVPAQGAPVPAAFLTLDPDGQTWTAVVSGDVTSYHSLAATTEPAGGSPAPTGEEAFSATLG